MSVDREDRTKARTARGVLGRIVIDTRPLRVPHYRRLWSSSAVIAVGSQLTAVAVPKQVYDLTHSSWYVGLTGALIFAISAVSRGRLGFPMCKPCQVTPYIARGYLIQTDPTPSAVPA